MADVSDTCIVELKKLDSVTITVEEAPSLPQDEVSLYSKCIIGSDTQSNHRIQRISYCLLFVNLNLWTSDLENAVP